MLTLLLAVVATGQGIESGPVVADWPLCRQPMPAFVGSIDVVGIVESVATKEAFRMRSGTDDSRPIWIDEFRGVSGQESEAGTKILSVTPRPPKGSRVLVPEKGEKYLLLALKPKGGRLDFWLSLDTIGYSLDAEPHEVAGLMLFPTKLEKAQSKIETANDVVALVADGFKIQTDENYRRLVLFLRQLQPYHQTAADDRDNYTLVIGATGPITELISSQIPDATPYRRSKIRELFLRWQLPMSHLEYVRQMMVLMRSGPSDYADEGESLVTDFGAVARTFQARTEANAYFKSTKEWIDAALSARNVVILRWFLRNFDRLMNESEIKRFAQLLNHEDREVRYLAAQIIARVTTDHELNTLLIDGFYSRDPEATQKSEAIIQYYRKKYEVD